MHIFFKYDDVHVNRTRWAIKFKNLKLICPFVGQVKKRHKVTIVMSDDGDNKLFLRAFSFTWWWMRSCRHYFLGKNERNTGALMTIQNWLDDGEQTCHGRRQSRSCTNTNIKRNKQFACFHFCNLLVLRRNSVYPIHQQQWIAIFHSFLPFFLFLFVFFFSYFCFYRYFGPLSTLKNIYFDLLSTRKIIFTVCILFWNDICRVKHIIIYIQ